MTELADKIDALAEKATRGPWQSVGTSSAERGDWFWLKAQPNMAMRGFTQEIGAINGSQVDPERQANASLIVELVNARETLTRALRDAERMREALESIQEYWNRDRNDTAMFDACWHAIEAAEAVLGDNT